MCHSQPFRLKLGVAKWGEQVKLDANELDKVLKKEEWLVIGGGGRGLNFAMTRIYGRTTTTT